MNSEALAAMFGLSALPATQPGIPGEGGTNYATSKARSDLTNGPGSGPFNAAVPMTTQTNKYASRIEYLRGLADLHATETHPTALRSSLGHTLPKLPHPCLHRQGVLRGLLIEQPRGLLERFDGFCLDLIRLGALKFFASHLEDALDHPRFRNPKRSL
jgi:hypothetical protein